MPRIRATSSRCANSRAWPRRARTGRPRSRATPRNSRRSATVEPARRQALWLRIADRAAGPARDLPRAAEAFERAEEIDTLSATSLAAWAGVLRELGATARWRTVFAASAITPTRRPRRAITSRSPTSLADAGALEEAAARLAPVFDREPANRGRLGARPRALREAAGDAEGATRAWTRAAEASAGLDAARAFRAAAAPWESRDRGSRAGTAHASSRRVRRALRPRMRHWQSSPSGSDGTRRHIQAASGALGGDAVAAPLTRDERLAAALAGTRSAHALARWPAAWEFAGEVLALAPRDADGWLARGVAAFHLGSPAASCRGLEAWLATEPPDTSRPLPLCVLADALAAQGDDAGCAPPLRRGARDRSRLRRGPSRAAARCWNGRANTLRPRSPSPSGPIARRWRHRARTATCAPRDSRALRAMRRCRSRHGSAPHSTRNRPRAGLAGSHRVARRGRSGRRCLPRGLRRRRLRRRAGRDGGARDAPRHHAGGCAATRRQRAAPTSAPRSWTPTRRRPPSQRRGCCAAPAPGATRRRCSASSPRDTRDAAAPRRTARRTRPTARRSARRRRRRARRVSHCARELAPGRLDHARGARRAARADSRIARGSAGGAHGRPARRSAADRTRCAGSRSCCAARARTRDAEQGTGAAARAGRGRARRTRRGARHAGLRDRRRTASKNAAGEAMREAILAVAGDWAKRCRKRAGERRDRPGDRPRPAGVGRRASSASAGQRSQRSRPTRSRAAPRRWRARRSGLRRRSPTSDEATRRGPRPERSRDATAASRARVARRRGACGASTSTPGRRRCAGWRWPRRSTAATGDLRAALLCAQQTESPAGTGLRPAEVDLVPWLALSGARPRGWRSARVRAWLGLALRRTRRASGSERAATQRGAERARSTSATWIACSTRRATRSPASFATSF